MMFVPTLTPDPIDTRDHIFEWNKSAIVPSRVDLREYTGMIENQLSINSCISNATVSACEMFLIANGELYDTPATDAMDLSRLFNYYCSRHNIGGQFATEDAGSIARESLRSARNQGLCFEVTWPYASAKWNTQPNEAAYVEASFKCLGEYARIQIIEYPSFKDANPIGGIKYALAQGFPVLVGMTVGERLITLTPDQIYSSVHPVTNPVIGGHEMVIVGYDDNDFIIENSWGNAWCDNGYFRCPASVVISNVIDLWVVKGFAGYTTVGDDVTSDIVKEAYRSMLHREADSGGYAYWIGCVEAGMTQADLRRNFARSYEFIASHLTIESLYRDILLREPDEGGLAWWKNSGLTIPQIIDEFIISMEFLQKFHEDVHSG